MYGADWYLTDRAAGIHNKRNFDVFYFVTIGRRVCNRQWLKMWKRVLPAVSGGKFLNLVHKVSMKFPDHDIHVIPMSSASTIASNREKLRRVLGRQSPHIFFTAEEEALGCKAMKELGIPQGCPCVCFQARDALYLDTMYPQIS